jgi:hypothetical protein
MTTERTERRRDHIPATRAAVSEVVVESMTNSRSAINSCLGIQTRPQRSGPSGEATRSTQDGSIRVYPVRSAIPPARTASPMKLIVKSVFHRVRA